MYTPALAMPWMVLYFPVPDPPTNVTAVVSYHSNTTVTVMWDTPLHYNTPLAVFFLEYCMDVYELECVREFIPVVGVL